MRIEIIDGGPADRIDDMRRDYLASLAAPFDGMWESFALKGRHLELQAGGERAGYFSLGDGGRVLQFHVGESFLPDIDDLFRAVLARDDVRGAMVSTADPGFLGPCVDHHRTVRAHTLLYEDRDHVEAEPEAGSQTALSAVEAHELDAIVAFQRESLDRDPGAWLNGYLENLIARRELHALRVGGEIVATGEARVSDSQPPFVDLGVITGRSYRRRGLASEVLGRMKRICRGLDLVPICSTTVENLGARKTIARAGFVSRHRILEIGF